MNIYKEAIQLKLRIPTSIGTLTVEELFNIPLTGPTLTLSDIVVALKDSLHNTADQSDFNFLGELSQSPLHHKLAIAIVEDVITTKQTHAIHRQTSNVITAQIATLKNSINTKKGTPDEDIAIEKLEKEMQRLQQDLKELA